MRIAIVESTHWHVPLYLDALEAPGLRVVGVTDSAQKTGAALAKRFGCEAYRDLDGLLDAQTVDFAFVFGRHIDMPKLAGKLIARGIAFAIEKPCGVRAIDVDRLVASAEAKKLYVAVPLIFRLSDTLDIVGHTNTRPDFASFRFMAGPPSRYEAAGTPWMLQRELAGGGPLINLGIHFIDLFSVLAQDDIESVSAVSSSEINGHSIEDVISVRMVTKQNRICTIECGYIFPSDKTIQREFAFSIRSPDAYYTSADDQILVRSKSVDGPIETRRLPARLETDVYYPAFVRRVLEEVRAGSAPVAGLRDVSRALRVVEAAYLSASRQGMPVQLSTLP
ncbi:MULTISPECIES: Gfo/Idh/MocA family oxidoreductase [unclassified Bradyrhizobium]|uniref:Gfo/Idh/MocA family protein n=1 Tax=unclassified Bradyrhizobium TaxID=2631580 RepID=UPI001FFB2124|nr:MULTISPECIES: Gfo/Idh/MocA family oxidoreductase [unclassified Bradyrhizobium]MCK1712169.1 Gfo/Idh/MocA family oxidoreductase [Bradyrhizobium sp. 143]MCK1729866.1 Gfo/Idh/MocA family oxidoreductase [Bradyrhizobium sp. 142]